MVHVRFIEAVYGDRDTGFFPEGTEIDLTEEQAARFASKVVVLSEPTMVVGQNRSQTRAIKPNASKRAGVARSEES